MSTTAAFFGAQIAAAVRNPAAPASFGGARGPSASPWNGGGLVLIECSSRPKKKATAHHIKTRPRKTQAWDIRREFTVYALLPPLPPDWVLASDGSSSDAAPSSLPCQLRPPPDF